MHLRMTGNLVLVEEPRRRCGFLRVALRARRRARAAVHRRPPLRDRRSCSPTTSSTSYFCGRARGSSRSPTSSRPRRSRELAAGRTRAAEVLPADQSGIAGIGNIYADEALYRARLHPLSPAGSMRREHVEALRDGIVDALEAGLSNGGASIDDYRDARGEQGSMQDEFLVHTREGEPCPRCGERDPAHRRRRPLDLLLPRLPGAAAPPAQPPRRGAPRRRGRERSHAASAGLRGRPLDRRPGPHRLHRRARPAGRARRNRRPRRRPGHTRDRVRSAPLAGTAEVTGVVFAGGSAFGLAAADGAMRWLEEHGRGLRDPGRARPDRPRRGGL